MASSSYKKLATRRLNPDTGKIVFPEPIVNNEALPPPSPSPLDVIIDPYGQYYCFVCQVSVPRGENNVIQHVSGKRHDVHNSRFSSVTAKHNVRNHILAQAVSQNRTLISKGLLPASCTLPAQTLSSPAPTPSVEKMQSQSQPHEQAATKNSVPPQTVQNTTPTNAAFQVTTPTPTNAATPTTATPPAGSVPLTTHSQAKQKADPGVKAREADRLKSLTIDKDAFLAELVADVADTSDVSTDSAGDDDEDEKTDRVVSEVHFENRLNSLKPLIYHAPPGPDYFFESMPEESNPTHTAARIRSLFQDHTSKADERKPKADQPENVNDDSAPIGKSDEKESESASRPSKASPIAEVEFIALTPRVVEKEKEDNEDAMSESDLIVLRDDNGERLPPWLLNRTASENVLYSADSSVALHFEILEFMRFMSPTAAEVQMRQEMIMMVESITHRLWPSCTTNVFGSYATGLYLPASDIDICVMNTPNGGTLDEFEKLAEAVRNVTGFAKRVNVVKAKVSLVKIIARKTSVNCDISIGVDNGLKNVAVIKSYIEQFPALRPLLLVVKCFLQQRGLNEVYTGGLGSYAIFLLVVSHLQMLKYNFPKSKVNLGNVLHQFFQLYGKQFNLCLAGIRVKDKGCYFDKFDRYQTIPGETMRYSMEDPNDETNELGRNGFLAWKVKKALNSAANTLNNWRRNDSTNAPTPLGAIIQSDFIFQLRRRRVIEDMQREGKAPIRETVTGRPLAPDVQRRVEQERLEASASQAANSSSATPGRAGSRRERDPRRQPKRRRSESGLDDVRENVTDAGTGGSSVQSARKSPVVPSGTSVRVPTSANASHARDVQDGYGTGSGGSAFENEMRAALAATRRELRMTDSGGYSRNGTSMTAATPGYQYAGEGVYLNGNMSMPTSQAATMSGYNSGSATGGAAYHGGGGSGGSSGGGAAHGGGRGGRAKRGHRPRRGGGRGR